MANHKSAKKRSRQALKRYKVNRSLLSKIKNNLNAFNSHASSKKNEEMQESFKLVNSSLAKAVKKGLIRKEYMSRKLSSLSNFLKQK